MTLDLRHVSGIGQVCGDCHGLSPLEAKVCVRCGLAIELGLGATANASASTDQEAVLNCVSCSAVIPPGHQFCVECGVVVRAVTMPVAPEFDEDSVAYEETLGGDLEGKARLTMIKGDDEDGLSYTLAGDEHVLGRVDSDLLFDKDEFISPRHANFFYRGKKLFVRDENSVNGVYVKTTKKTELNFGGYFLVGEQILRIEKSEKSEFLPKKDGTYRYGTPMTTAYFRIVQVLRGGETALACRPLTNMISLGREGNDLNFPLDPFISGHHAQITIENEKITLTDLDSKNGTFVKIKDEAELVNGDFVFLGQQLFRVDLT